MDKPITKFTVGMGTKEAGRYISDALNKRGKRLSAATIKNYVDRGEIPYRLIGRTRVFAKADLDAFIDSYTAANVKPGPKPGSHHKRTQS